MHTPDDALDEAQRAAVQGRLRNSTHARQRMEERGVSEADVEQALITAKLAQPDFGDSGSEDKWKFEGTDLDDEPLEVVVSFDDGYPRLVTVK